VLAPTMAELGVGLVPFSPLGRGFLTATVDSGTLTDGDSRRHHPRFQGENATSNQRLVETVRQVALAWVHAQHTRLGIPIVPIPGTSRPERVEENVAALNLALDATALAELEPIAGLAAGSRFGALQAAAQPAPAK